MRPKRRPPYWLPIAIISGIAVWAIAFATVIRTIVDAFQ